MITVFQSRRVSHIPKIVGSAAARPGLSLDDLVVLRQIVVLWGDIVTYEFASILL